MKKIFLTVLVMVMLAATVVVANPADSVSIFFRDAEKYSEKNPPKFMYKKADLGNVLDFMRTNESAISFVRGYATVDEGYKKADYLRRLNNVSAGDYRASRIYDALVMENPWLNSRVFFLPAVVDSTIRGVEFFAMDQSYAGLNDLLKLSKKFDDLTKVVATGDSALDERVTRLERRSHQVVRQSEPIVKFGLGCEGIYFPEQKKYNKNYFFAPAVQFSIRLSEHFIAHANGGFIPTAHNPDLFGGILSATMGYKLGKIVELNAGYVLASEFNKKFQWKWRADGATLGLGLNIDLGPVTLYPHASAIYANRWGAIGGLSIIF